MSPVKHTHITFLLVLLHHYIIVETTTEFRRNESGKEDFLEVSADTNAKLWKSKRCEESLQRNKRSLIFPTGGIIQITLGIGINPNIEDTSMNINFGFQQNVPLPTNLTQLRLPPSGRVGKAMSSGNLLSSLEQILERYGLHGNHCVRKSICEMAASSFHANEIFEEIIKHMLTPSAHPKLEGSMTNDTQMETYIEAEKLGQREGSCERAFPHCTKSLLELISQSFLN